MYKDVNVNLATLGVHGNALFFYVSGFLLVNGLFDVKQVNQRLGKIYQTLLDEK